MADKKAKKTAKQLIDQNPVEAIKNLGGGIASSFKTDVGKGVISGLWEQMLGAGTKEKKGDLNEGEELNLKAIEEQEKQKQLLEIDPGIDYRREIIHAEKRIASENSKEIEVKIQEIIIELKKLIASSKELQVQFKEVTVERVPANAGKYHVNFFEWMITLIRSARMKVEESQSWLSLFQSKKAKKGYWSMFKKHGTTFGLSNERVVATQTG